MTDKTTDQAVEAAELTKRLRDACLSVRGKAYPLSELIPLMQKAADALDRPVAEVVAPVGGPALVRFNASIGDEPDPVERLRFFCSIEARRPMTFEQMDELIRNHCGLDLDDSDAELIRKIERHHGITDEQKAPAPSAAVLSALSPMARHPWTKEHCLNYPEKAAHIINTALCLESDPHAVERAAYDQSMRGFFNKDGSPIEGAAQPILAQDAKPGSGHLAGGAGGNVHAPLTVTVCHLGDGDDPFVFQCNGRVTKEVLADIDKELQDNRDTLFPDGPGDYEYSVSRYHGQYGEYGRCELAPGWEFDQIGFKPLPQPPDAAILSSEQDQGGGGGRGV
jgi:hypothetical protein